MLTTSVKTITFYLLIMAPTNDCFYNSIQFLDDYFHNRLYVENVLKILIASWPIQVACYVQLAIQNTKYWHCLQKIIENILLKWW